MNTLINIGLIIAYITIFGSIGLILFFAISSLVKNFKETATSLFGLGFLLIVFLISFLISKSNDISLSFFEKTGTNPASSKIIGSGLIMLYVLIFGIFITIIYSQISRFLKK